MGERESSKKGVEDSGPSPDEVEEEPKLVSLCLGRSPKRPKKDEPIGNSSKPKNMKIWMPALPLVYTPKACLQWKLASDLSPMNSSEELKEADGGGTCSTHKSLRTKDGGDDISEL
ncbi:hypothetical protein SESBI_40425 [Sesbania bispinosa]|nr:hypothetical protein SESBI_40425 [Sesbania bispinosa]